MKLHPEKCESAPYLVRFTIKQIGKTIFIHKVIMQNTANIYTTAINFHPITA